MSDYALTPIEQHQLALLHAHLQAGGGLAAPFAKEIFLIETHVAAALSLFASVALLFWYVLRILMSLRRN